MSQQLELLSENPSQWTAVSFVTPDIQKKEIKPFVALALKELEGAPDPRTRSLQHADKFAAVRSIVRHFARLRSATKEVWDAKEVATFLEGLRLSSDCVTELTSLLCTDQLYDNVPSHLRIKPGIVGMQWRIDVSLSQSSITTENAENDPQRTKEIMHRDTHILLSLHLSDGSTKNYRLSLAKFHELRFTIASALKSMIVLERRKCMRAD